MARSRSPRSRSILGGPESNSPRLPSSKPRSVSRQAAAAARSKGYNKPTKSAKSSSSSRRRKRRSLTPFPKNMFQQIGGSKTNDVGSSKRSCLALARTQENEGNDEGSDDDDDEDEPPGENPERPETAAEKGSASSAEKPEPSSPDVAHTHSSGSSPPAAAAPAKTDILKPPIKSPRDINRYRVIQLPNGLKAVLISTCAYGLQKAREELAKAKANAAHLPADKCSVKNPKPTSIFERARLPRSQLEQLYKKKGEEAKTKTRISLVLDCTEDERIERFDKLIVETPDSDNSVLESVQTTVDWFRTKIRKFSTGENEDEDEDAAVAASDDASFLLTFDEPMDEELERRACSITQKSVLGDSCQIALTIGCGLLDDPPNAQGISQLATQLIKQALVVHKEFSTNYTYSQFSGIATPEMTTLDKSCDLKALRAHIEILGEAMSELIVGKSPQSTDADRPLYVGDVWSLREDFQCLHCWAEREPIDDPRRFNLIHSLAKSDHLARGRHSITPPPDGNPKNQQPPQPQQWQWSALAGTEEADEAALRARILDFIGKHYCAASITLAVKAPASLDTLQTLVETSFGSVSAKPRLAVASEDLLEGEGRATAATGTGGGGEESPFDTPEFRKFYHVQCNNAECCADGDAFLVISWAPPPKFGLNHLAKPLEYIRELILNGSRGGLPYTLKQKDFATSVDCDVTSNKYYSMLSIQLELSETGLHDIDSAVSTVLTFLEYLQDSVPSGQLFSDQQIQKIIYFHALGADVNIRHPYQQQQQQQQLWARNLSEWLQRYNSEELLTGPLLTRKFDGRAIGKCLSYLTAQNGNYMLFTCPQDSKAGSSSRELGFVESLVEPIYRTRYQVEEITPARYSIWSQYSIAKKLLGTINAHGFNMPSPNTFFDRRMCLVDQTSEDVIFLDNNVYKPYKIWYQQNLAERNYIASYLLHIISPVAYTGIENVLCRRLWGMMLEDEIDASLYGANLADIFHYIKSTPYGLLIHLSSWNRKCTDAVALVVQTVKNFGQVREGGVDLSSKPVFEAKKRNLLKHFAALLKDQFCSRLDSNLYETVTNIDCWSIAELHTVLKEVQLQDVSTFIQEFQSKWTAVGFVYGNILRGNALELASIIETFLSPSTGVERFRRRKLQLPRGERVIRFKSVAEDALEYCVTNFYQIGMSDVKSRVMDRMICNKLYDHLRDYGYSARRLDGKQYMMYARLIEEQAIVTLKVTGYAWLSSGEINLDELNDFMEEGLESFIPQQSLEDMCDDEFNLWKTMTADSLTPPTASHERETAFLQAFFSLQDLTFRFNELHCQLEALKTVALDEVTLFYRNNFHEVDGCNYHKVSIQQYPRNTEPPPRALEIYIPRNLEEWRTRHKWNRQCSYHARHKLLHKHKRSTREDLSLELDPEFPGKCDNSYFLTDLPAFKRTLFQFPYKLKTI